MTGERAMKRALLLLLAGCLDTRIDYVGKRCSAARPCPEGLQCEAASSTCQLGAGGADGGCESSPPVTCTLRDVALAPGVTPSGADLTPGTRFVLQNTDYPALRISGSGAAGCPIVVTGPARFTDTLTLEGSYLRATELSFRVTQRLYALRVASGSTNIDLRRLHFTETATARPMATEYPFDIALESSCAEVTVAESEFVGVRAPAIFGHDTCGNVMVKGNRFRTDAYGPTVQIEGTSGTVEGNELSGDMGYAAVEFVNGGTGTVRRNWFHDLTHDDLIAVRGAQTVTSNTFSRLPVAASCGTFRNNVVQQVTTPLTCGTAARGYNLLDQVTNPGTLDTTDKTGSALLGADGVPQAGSPALDSADPALPVPPGGGARADIGAFERGAVRLRDGTYCAP